MKKFLVVLAVILALGGAGYWVGLPRYRHWKMDRLVVQAQESLRKGDLKNAGLSARQALAINASNPAACRIMAVILESFRRPAALEWRQRVVDLEPGSLTNQLDLASCGILLGDYVRAARALQSVAKTNQDNASFHQLAAMVAVGLNQIGEAERHFAEAIRLDPGNKGLEFNQAVIHLQATNRQVVASALKSLEKLYADPAYRKDALRHLAMAASRNQDFAKAAVFTDQLQADPGATFADRLMHLTALKESASPEFNAYLTGLKSACAADAERVNALAGWLLGHALADDAARWLADLPAEMQAKSAVALARADCFMAQSDWPGLQALLQNTRWDEVDFLRQAILARAYREQRQEFTAQTEWIGAVRAATDHAKQLGVLARLANKWGWDKEKEELLWLIAQRFPAEHWALQSLQSLYFASGNTRGLFRVYSTLVGYNDKDFAAKNNLATVSLLLNLQTNKAHEMAREAWLRAKTNKNSVAFAATYAWSLHLQGRTAEGLGVLAALPPDQLEIPGVALYYGAMQVAVNAPAKAKKYLDLAATGQLLPEEKSLLDAAKKGL